MSSYTLRDNVQHMKAVVRELYIFTQHLHTISRLEASNHFVDVREKRLLEETIRALTAQLRIMNTALPSMIQSLSVYKTLPSETRGKSSRSSAEKKQAPEELLATVPVGESSLTITQKDRTEFLNNLRRSRLSVQTLKEKYGFSRNMATFGKPNWYAKFSNSFFRNTSNALVREGYFGRLNRYLRRMNSPFVVDTYVAMGLMTMTLVFCVSVLLVAFLLFFNVGVLYPFISRTNEFFVIRVLKFIWLILLLPACAGGLLYLYPASEARSIGKRIDQELPFVTIHLAAIASSRIEPLHMFTIILKSGEYRYTNPEIRKIINLVNFHGRDLVTALKDTARTNSSRNLKDLLEGLATTITSGGDLQTYLNKHAENLLFEYRLEREKYIKTSETFMDIYISVVIAAPMIFLMLFVIMGSTGSLSTVFGLSVQAVSFLIIFVIALINILFLGFLTFKQPVI